MRETWGARLRDGRTALVDVELDGDRWRCPTPGAPRTQRAMPSQVLLVVALSEGWDVAALLSPEELAEELAQRLAEATPS